jgi:hypothetical protein
MKCPTIDSLFLCAFFFFRWIKTFIEQEQHQYNPLVKTESCPKKKKRKKEEIKGIFVTTRNEDSTYTQCLNEKTNFLFLSFGWIKALSKKRIQPSSKNWNTSKKRAKACYNSRPQQLNKPARSKLQCSITN